MDTNGARTHTTPGEQELSAEEALRRLQEQVRELQAYFTYFVSAKIDGFKLSARQYAVWAALGVLGLIALAGLVIEAMVLVLVGAAAGFALLFNGRLWLGHDSSREWSVRPARPGYLYRLAYLATQVVPAEGATIRRTPGPATRHVRAQCC
jgi:hypothetical protein